MYQGVGQSFSLVIHFQWPLISTTYFQNSIRPFLINVHVIDHQLLFQPPLQGFPRLQFVFYYFIRVYRTQLTHLKHLCQQVVHLEIQDQVKSS